MFRKQKTENRKQKTENREQRNLFFAFRFTFSVFCLLSSVFCLLAIPSVLCVEEQFAYDSKGKRDPFIPLITGERIIGIGLMGIETVEDIKLEGIVWDPEGDSLAILNGIILRENEQVDNVRITEIEPKRISIMINENEYTIKLIKEEEEGE